MYAHFKIVIFEKILGEKIIEKTTFDVSYDELNYFKNLLVERVEEDIERNNIYMVWSGVAIEQFPNISKHFYNFFSYRW